MSFLSKLKSYAPSIASAILSGGATLPAIAIKAVSDAVGLDPDSPRSVIERAVNEATADQILMLKQSDQGFSVRMKELSNDLVSTELGDVQNARLNHKDSIMPAVIVIALTVMVSLSVAGLFFFNIPPANVSTLYFLLGSIVTAWLSSIAYWVGTTRSSSVKTKLMSGIK